MVSFTAQLAVLLVLAFLLGSLVGYLLWIHGWRRRIDGDAGRLPRLEADHAAVVDDLRHHRAEVEQLHDEAEQREAELEALQATLRDREDELQTRSAPDPVSPDPVSPDPVSPDREPGDPGFGDPGSAEELDRIDEVAGLQARVAALSEELEEAANVRAQLDARAVRADEFRRRARRAEAQARRLRARLAAERIAERRSAAGVAPTDDGPDDLTRIEGIGPTMAKALRAGGIHDFAALRDADVDRLREVLASAGLRFAPSVETWSEQAGHLARGDQAAFDELNAHLVTGRRASR